jgi:hypothetical protein
MPTYVRAKRSDVWHWHQCHYRPKPENIDTRRSQDRRPSGDACPACLATDKTKRK